MLDKLYIDSIIMTALKEDAALGDITTDNLIDNYSFSHALFIAKESGVIAGLDISERVFKILDEGVKFKRNIADGASVKNGDVIAEIEGNTRALLKESRTC